MTDFDVIMVGQVCLDVNTDCDGSVTHAFGGAALYSGYSAAAIPFNRAAVLAKANPDELNLAEAYAKCPPIKVIGLDSERSTRMENTYFTPDRERRLCRCTAAIDPYKPSDLPELSTRLYHLAGLIKGDIDEEFIEACAKRADVALDVQCMLRCRQSDDSMVFHDWDAKERMMPRIQYLKTDAAEAEILTGTSDRVKAAQMLCDMGAGEVMITHNSEVLVCFEGRIYGQPLKPRSLVGRTGRGDTTFAAYLGMRKDHDAAYSLLWAAATVSLKMETPGPFIGTCADVEKYIEEFYCTR